MDHFIILQMIEKLKNKQSELSKSLNKLTMNHTITTGIRSIVNAFKTSNDLNVVLDIWKIFGAFNFVPMTIWNMDDISKHTEKYPEAFINMSPIYALKIGFMKCIGMFNAYWCGPIMALRDGFSLKRQSDFAVNDDNALVARQFDYAELVPFAIWVTVKLIMHI